MRYRGGWLVEGQVLALTHFEPVVTQDDFGQIIALATAVIQGVRGEFHMLIDNRIMADQNVATLDSILQIFPLLDHPQLRWIVIVLPEAIGHTAQTLPAQRRGHIQIAYVDSLERAFEHLRSADASIDWQAQDRAFFTAPAQPSAR